MQPLLLGCVARSLLHWRTWPRDFRNRNPRDRILGDFRRCEHGELSGASCQIGPVSIFLFSSSLKEATRVARMLYLLCDTVQVRIEGTENGRVFMSGADGFLYELQYGAISGWLDTYRTCAKRNCSRYVVLAYSCRATTVASMHVVGLKCQMILLPACV